MWEHYKILNNPNSVNSEDDPRFDLEVFVDEKNFEFVTKSSRLCLAKDVSIDDASEYWRHKSHIPALMFFGAICRVPDGLDDTSHDSDDESEEEEDFFSYNKFKFP